MKLFVATPAFDGKTHVTYTTSLCDMNLLLSGHQIPMIKNISVSGSLLVAERNRLLKNFLSTDCTHVLCVDSDIGWGGQSVIEMLKHDLDFVAALYPARGTKEFLFRPFLDEKQGLMKHECKTLFKMQYIPAGFMLIKRRVIEKMVADNPQLYFEPKAERFKSENGYCLFDTEVRDGEFWGEDYVFCRRVRQSGFDIWIDPFVQLDHAGTVGAFYEFLNQNKEESEKQE